MKGQKACFIFQIPLLTKNNEQRRRVICNFDEQCPMMALW